MSATKYRNLIFDLGNVIIDLDVNGAFEKLDKLFIPGVNKALIEKAMIDYECGRISTDIFINSLLRQSHRNDNINPA